MGVIINTIDQIKDVLAQVRPLIMSDGGDIEFVKYEDDIVYVRLLGACTNCPASYFTLKMGVEQALQAKIPTIKEVIPVDN